MWAAQAFMLYGGEPGYQHQLMINPPGSNIAGNPMGGRNLLNSSLGGMGSGIDRNSPQMFMSTPMPNIGSPMCRTLQSTPIQSPLQQTQYPLSPSEFELKLSKFDFI